MATRVQARPPGAGSPTPKVRHLYEGTRANPPRVGSTALCGHRAVRGDFAAPEAGVWSRDVTPEHCVVCVELARGQGFV